MPDVAVTQIDGQNFQLLNCLRVVNSRNETTVSEVDNPAIEELLNPLRENYEESSVENFKLKIKDFLPKLLKKKDPITPFKIEQLEEYKIYFHKFGKDVFGFLLRPLTDEDLSKIEKDSVGKSYLTGDPSDLFKTEKDFQ